MVVMLLLLVFEQVVQKFQFQLDSLAFSFTSRFILSSACCIHLHSVQIAHNFAAIRLLHSDIVSLDGCIHLHSDLFRLLHSDFMLFMLLLQSVQIVHVAVGDW
ncbi:hypothetical protein Hanom_Chr12g01107841 [Helianthus anomalus]